MKRYADHGRYLLPFLLFLILSSSALAQSPSETTIAVEGQITNGTTGAPVPANLPLMLHTYEGETMTTLQAIADLDDAREMGTIEEEAYREKRTRLRTQAVVLLAERRQAT